ncbi:acyltransferase family protein [Burkholderia cenocepacia]|uniref:acyltransferase family protein n=2 Tax=Burkholderia cepacia complex TaxID=87882 RepID=UPI000847CBC9|nr:acyltransferase [Burkholderia cenocepacia]
MQPSKKNIDIEALRAVGIIFVLIPHSEELFPWGLPVLHKLYSFMDFWTGVDLFFCVSGYIITRSVLRELSQHGGWKDFARFAVPFWIRRAWRLWPTAWFWLTFLLIGSFLFRESGYFGIPVRNFLYQIYAMLHMANFYGFFCKEHLTCGINQVYWSLSTEEQFYFLFPILMFAVPKRWWPTAFAIIFALQFPLNRGGSMLGFIRTDAIALGVLIALWRDHMVSREFEPTFLRSPAVAAATTAFLVIALGALGSAAITVVPISTGLVAVVSGIMVFMASFDKGYIVPWRFARPIASYIGSRSYTLYVVHIPAFVTAKEIWFHLLPPGTHLDGTYTLRFGLLGLALLITFTELNYRLLENPLRKYGARIAARKRGDESQRQAGVELPANARA